MTVCERDRDKMKAKELVLTAADVIIPVPTTPAAAREGNSRKRWSGSYVGEGPCAVCGYNVRKARVRIHVVGGGGMMVPKSMEPYDDGGADLGGQPVGPECVKLIPKAYRNYPKDISRMGPI